MSIEIEDELYKILDLFLRRERCQIKGISSLSYIGIYPPKALLYLLAGYNMVYVATLKVVPEEGNSFLYHWFFAGIDKEHYGTLDLEKLASGDGYTSELVEFRILNFVKSDVKIVISQLEREEVEDVFDEAYSYCLRAGECNRDEKRAEKIRKYAIKEGIGGTWK